MKKNKVLIVTYYWPPSGGSGVQRHLKFAKYLPELGYEPIILTSANPSYLQLDESFVREVSQETKVFKIKGFEPFALYTKLKGGKQEAVDSSKNSFNTKESLLSRFATWVRANIFIPDARIGWSLNAKKEALKLIEELDIEHIITTGPPQSLHLVGKYVKKKKPSINWICDLRDPWSFVFYNDVFKKAALAKKIDARMELSVLKKADHVVVVSDGTGEAYKKIFNRNYTTITNGFDHADLIHSKEPETNSIYTIRYIGLIAESYDLDPFLTLVSKLSEKHTFKLEFIGDINPNLSKSIASFGLENVVTVGTYVPHAEALQAMKGADLLLLLIPDVTNYDFHIPGKLFEYVGSGTSILNIGSSKGDSAKIITELDRGASFQLSDHEGISNFLAEMISSTNEERAISAIQPDKTHPFSRYTLTTKLAELLK